jgi:hypothetical protein
VIAAIAAAAIAAQTAYWAAYKGTTVGGGGSTPAGTEVSRRIRHREPEPAWTRMPAFSGAMSISPKSVT